MVIFIFIVVFVLIFLSGIAMGEDEGIFSLLCMIIAIFFSVGLYFAIEEEGHKQGQIEAINGNINYELVIHEDSTRTWEKIEEK